MSLLEGIMLVSCLGISFFLSGMEAGVFALSRFRIRRLLREGDARARLLHQYLENTEDFLWTIFVGNALANFVAAVLTVLVIDRWFGTAHAWFWLVFIPGGLLFYAAFDLLPKMLFRLYPNALCLLFLRPYRVVHAMLGPVVWLMARFSAWMMRRSGRTRAPARLFGTRDELRQLVQESAQKMNSEERGMIQRVLDLQTVTVGRIMTPLARTAGVLAQSPVSEVLDLCRARGLTRLPVWSEVDGRRRVAGLLNVRSLLYESNLDPRQAAGAFVKPALYLNEEVRLEDALKQLQRSGQRLAIVLDAQRAEIGVVGLQDILTVVFGEFRL
jgi:putative hemolysin